ncbi:carbonic anhydrase family protein, partial [Neobacillus cucumis]|uniref:carbonic anhydrase family protein n=1 Tax=Neobacillus cucumis TaxID=1740721 RepID=UPI0036113261
AQTDASSPFGPLLLGALLGLVLAVTGASQPALADAKGVWGYKDTSEWNAGFPLCLGKEQSPINLKKSDVSLAASESLAPRLSYKPLEKTQIFNNGGKNVQVNGGFGTFKLPDGEYEVKQFHFHFPAEHEVDGKLAAGELHIVHQRKGASGTDGLAVVGIVLEEQNGAADTSELTFLKQ